MDKFRSDCTCVHHHYAPSALAGLALIFALFALGVMNAEIAAVSWPALLVSAGAAKVAGRGCTCCAPRSLPTADGAP